MAISNPNLSQISAELAKLLPKLKPMSSVPPGMIGAFNSVPEGWLRCNGAAVSRTTYAALFAVIGTKYGSGDGSTTFNLPNLHHRFIEATTSDSEIGDRVSEGLPNITVSIRTSGTGNNNHLYHPSSSNGTLARGFTDNVQTEYFSSGSYGGVVQPSSLRLVHCIKI